MFTRYPQPGHTKTRLIPALGEKQAAALQKRMAEHTFSQCCELAASRKVVTAVHYTGGDEKSIRSWIPAGMHCRPQGPGSLGERLQQSFAQSFSAGKERVIIVGSDCPFLTADILAAGFNLLRDHDLAAD